jgi:predicted ATPase
MTAAQGFLRAIRLLRDEVPTFERYPFSIPAVRGLDELALDPRVTFLVGDNGSGKSTLIEAIAVATGFNAEGGSRNFSFSTRRSESELHRFLRPVRGTRRPRDGFFLRAESYFTVGSEIERLGVVDSYGGVSPHEQSHGESFLALANHRFHGDGLYLLDEPEAALSPQRQLSLLQILHDLVERTGSQLLIATHSPILMAYPGATLYHLGPDGIRAIAYEDTEHFRITRDFLNGRDAFFRHLFAEPADGS